VLTVAEFTAEAHPPATGLMRRSTTETGVLMMRARLFAVLISAAAVGAACSQSPRSPLSPVSATSSSSTAVHAGPQAYDATGLWFGTFFVGEQQIGEGVHAFTQSPSGSLVAVGTEAPDDPERDHRTYTFKRVGSPHGAARTFRLTIAGQGPDEPCATDLSGHAQLNTGTDVIEGTATGVIPNCATATVTIKWVKQ
jgi:hypothetical protein